MASKTIPDNEFIELWGKFKSAAKLAEHLKITERSVLKRRRNLEIKYNTSLEGVGYNARFYKHLSPAKHEHRKNLSVKNGIVLVFSDAHFWPGVRTTAFRALLQFIEKLNPVAIINNGDCFDGASISRYPRIGWDSKPTVIDELKTCAERLEEIEDIACNAKLIWPLGNHDSRFETRLAANAPQYENVKGFSLKDHFIKWEPCWACWINDDVVVKHRFKGGIHATHNNTIWSGKTIITGHLHSLKVTPFDDYNGTRWGVDTGTLADPRGPQFVDYTEDNPVNWRSGFIVLSFIDGQLMWPEVVRVVSEGVVDFRGHMVGV
jgi:hypothetical protein